MVPMTTPQTLQEDVAPAPGSPDLDDWAQDEDEGPDDDYGDEPEGNEMRGATAAELWAPITRCTVPTFSSRGDAFFSPE